MTRTATTMLMAAAAALMIGAGAGSALAQDATGVWSTDGNKGRVRVAKCGDGICGTLISLAEPNDTNGQPKKDAKNEDASKRNRPLIGVSILQSMKPDQPNRWKGSIYNAEDGKTYTAYFTLQGDSAKVEGCVLGGVICKAQSWTRAR